MTVTNLSEIQKMLEPIKAFVLDMDGTIYLGNELFEFTPKFLDQVAGTNREYYFFTNNSSKDINDYVTKLNRMGIEIKRSQIMVSTHVIEHFLKENHPGAKLYVVGTPALKKAFRQNGWDVVEEQPDIVILGFDTTLTYEKLSKACEYIRDGCTYYGINPDFNCPLENNRFIPDCGSMAKCIEASTGKFPEFFGKPSKRTLEYIVKHTGLKQSQIAIIGDRLYTDIAVADDSEVTSILVLSGETKKEDLKTSPHHPSIMVEDIGVLIDLL